MEEIVTIVILVLTCGIKFVLAIPAVVLAGYNYWETIFISLSGGLSGFFGFYYFGDILKLLYRRYFPLRKKSSGKKFTRFIRFIITIKNKYGLIGLAILTPSILSIPLGSILAARYFGRNRMTIPYMASAIVIWAFIFTSFYFLF